MSAFHALPPSSAHAAHFAATIAHPLASRWHTDLPVYVGRRPRGPLAELWPELKRYRHQSLLP